MGREPVVGGPGRPAEGRELRARGRETMARLLTAGVQVFSRADVKKRLNLTPKQNNDIQTVAEEVGKAGAEIRKDAFSSGRPDATLIRR